MTADIQQAYQYLDKNIREDKNTALVVIDVQPVFCDPAYLEMWPKGNKETEAVSKRIQKLSHDFRKASIPVIAVYFAPEDEKNPFYIFSPEKNDTIVRKTKTSAFKCGHANFDELLKSRKYKNILVCGFNLCACVKATAIDAQKNGFNTYLLSDLSGEGGDAHIHNYKATAKASMTKAGVEIIKAAELLRHIKKAI